MIPTDFKKNINNCFQKKIYLNKIFLNKNFDTSKQSATVKYTVEVGVEWNKIVMYYLLLHCQTIIRIYRIYR